MKLIFSHVTQLLWQVNLWGLSTVPQQVPGYLYANWYCSIFLGINKLNIPNMDVVCSVKTMLGQWVGKLFSDIGCQTCIIFHLFCLDTFLDVLMKQCVAGTWTHSKVVCWISLSVNFGDLLSLNMKFWQTHGDRNTIAQRNVCAFAVCKVVELPARNKKGVPFQFCSCAPFSTTGNLHYLPTLVSFSYTHTHSQRAEQSFHAWLTVLM